MITADRVRQFRINRLWSDRSPATVSRDAPSTLFELVGIVLDPSTPAVVPQQPAKIQELRPSLQTRRTA